MPASSPSVVLEIPNLLILVLALTLPHGAAIAQESRPCGHSTVEAAWGPQVASEAKTFLAKLQHIVETNDKTQFASVVHFPLRLLGGEHADEIRSRSDLIRRYSSIVTPDIRNAILKQTGDCLFGNGQGMRIGKGQVWFQKESNGDMRIITINLSDAKPD